MTKKHYSDCAVHNEPAYPAGDCDCGGYEDISEIEALRAENARLRGQKEGWKGLQAGTSDIVKQLEAENAKLLRRIHLFKNTRNEKVFEKLMKAHEEIARLREALKPFADLYDVDDGDDDCYPILNSDLRAARAAIGESDDKC